MHILTKANDSNISINLSNVQGETGHLFDTNPGPDVYKHYKVQS